MFNGVVTYDTSTSARLVLKLSDLDDLKINSNNATVSLADGDGCFTSEYTLNSNKLTGSRKNGRSSYSLQQGDLAINTGGYLITDTNSGRGWTCLGGDGQGNYTFNLKVSGITYNGLPVGSQTFRVHIYIYGSDYTSGANETFGSGTTVEPILESLSKKVSDPPSRGTTPVYTWVGDDEKPNLAYDKADDIYITWPVGTGASALEAGDVHISLHSAQGDTLTLKEDRHFVINTSSGEMQIPSLCNTGRTNRSSARWTPWTLST